MDEKIYRRKAKLEHIFTEIKAEFQLAVQEWASLIAHSYRYQSHMVQAGTPEHAGIWEQLQTNCYAFLDWVVQRTQRTESILHLAFEQLEALSKSETLRTILASARKISQQSWRAKIKLTRILRRLLASAINKDTAAFELALKDLIELATEG